MFDMYIFVVFPIVSQKVREISGTTININKLIIYQQETSAEHLVWKVTSQLDPRWDDEEKPPAQVFSGFRRDEKDGEVEIAGDNHGD
jgi:hypothetical protein